MINTNIGTVKNYSLDRNDDGTYCVFVETDMCDITYPSVKVTFFNDGLVYPSTMKLLDKEGKIIYPTMCKQE